LPFSLERFAVNSNPQSESTLSEGADVAASST